MVTLERLREALDYNPHTGVFTWRIKPRRGPARGIAGTISARGYAVIWIDGKGYKSHRLAWLYIYGRWPEPETDHIDGDKLNNAISNLREATRSQNNRNAALRIDNQLQARGVYYSKVHERYIAAIQKDKKRITLGYFQTLEEAVSARLEAEKKLFGEFASCHRTEPPTVP